MKKYVLYALGIVMLAALGIGCGKSNGDGQVSIQKKWSLVSDSSYGGVGNTYYRTAHPVTISDYWDFRKDGHVYVKEGTSLDTMTYTLNSSTSITISKFGWGGASTIRTLTATRTVIQSPIVIPPGGPSYRVLHLRR
jgi:hypothetical protein